MEVDTGIRQGDSLSEFLFNLTMDIIIEHLPLTQPAINWDIPSSMLYAL